MLPARARDRKKTRPQRRAVRNFNLPYPPGRKPREREPEETEIFDPFEYIPHRYHAPNIVLRLSNTPPTSVQYEIVDRVNSSNGLPKYILREVKAENGGQELKYNTKEKKNEHGFRPSGSNHHEDVTADFNPIGALHTTLLRTRRSQKALRSHDSSSRSQFSPLIHKQTSSEGSDNGEHVFSVPYDRILSYASPLQLERFEHSRFENPTVDDMPWLASQQPTSSSLSSFSGEDGDKIAYEQRPKKRRKINGPLVVIARHDTASLGTNANAVRSSMDTLDEDENYIDVGRDHKLSGDVAITPSQPSRYGMLERRPRSTSSLGDSTRASSSTAQNEEIDLEITTQQRELPSGVRHRIAQSESKQNLGRMTGSLELFAELAIERGKKGDQNQDYEVSRILAHTYVDGVTYYKVSCVGHPESKSYLTWLVEEELQGASMVLRRYKREMGIDSEESDVSDEDESEEVDLDASAARIALEQDNG